MHNTCSDLTKKSFNHPKTVSQNMDLRILLVLISFLAFVNLGEAINCYHCTSYTESKCDDPFNFEDNAQPKSGNTFLKACPEDGKDYFCRKIYQNVRGEERIIRGCGHEKYFNLDGEEKNEYSSVVQEYKVYVSACFEDRCNGSETIQVSMIFVLMAFVLAAVFK